MITKVICKCFDCNSQKIEDYDVLEYREGFIKKLKKVCSNKDEFAKKLKNEFMHRYWSKAEYELIIKIDKDNHVWLYPWCGCRDKEVCKVDVTNDSGFDWKGFADYHINTQIFKDEAKIDIYDQITYGDRFDNLVTKLWTTRLKYERDNEKFHV